MSDAVASVFAEWSLPPSLTIAIILIGCLYTRGWFAIRQTRPADFNLLRLTSFLSGLAVAWVAIASPLDGFADLLLSAHMVEHLLLMSAVPPLLLLGCPLVPILRGLPAWVLTSVGGLLLRISFLRRLGRWLVSPLVGWTAMNAVFLGWHVPAAFDFALDHEHWHQFEHLTFLAGAMLFWWSILRPWPTAKSANGWGLVFSLISADLVNTALSAFLAFCGRPFYQYYVHRVSPFPVSALSDQTTGAVIMWVFGSLAFLVPATLLTFRLLQWTGSGRA